MTRYAGVFANRHHLRRAIAPKPALPPTAPVQLPVLDRHGALAEPTDNDAPPARPRRIGWAKLLARIFGIDVLACARCGGRLAATAAVLERDEIALLLHGARGPPRASPPGQLELFG